MDDCPAQRKEQTDVSKKHDLDEHLDQSEINVSQSINLKRIIVIVQFSAVENETFLNYSGNAYPDCRKTGWPCHLCE